ncbi:hypothetical protein [Paraburkholderia terrae]
MTVRTIETTTVAFAKKRDRILTNERRSLPERWHDFVMDAEAGMRRYRFKQGCLVGNLGQERGVLPEGYRERSRIVLDRLGRRSAQGETGR